MQRFISAMGSTYYDTIKSYLAHGDQTALDTIKKVLLSAIYNGVTPRAPIIPEGPFQYWYEGGELILRVPTTNSAKTTGEFGDLIANDYEQDTVPLQWLDEGPRKAIMNRGRFTPRANNINNALAHAEEQMIKKPKLTNPPDPVVEGFAVPHVKNNSCRGKPQSLSFNPEMSVGVTAETPQLARISIIAPRKKMILTPTIWVNGVPLVQGAPLVIITDPNQTVPKNALVLTWRRIPFNHTARKTRPHRRWNVRPKN